MRSSARWSLASDFEKRIASIYQKCRTEQQIRFEFDALQLELAEILEGQRDAQEKLLNNFDQEVIERSGCRATPCWIGSTIACGS